MLLTFTLVVLLGSILLFFSDEFTKFLKKIWGIRGVKLFVPLFAASWLLLTFEHWFLFGLLYVYDFMHQALNFLIRIMPFQQGAVSVALVLILSFFSIIPLLIIDVIYRKIHYTPYPYPYITGFMIWIICVVLIVIL